MLGASNEWLLIVGGIGSTALSANRFYRLRCSKKWLQTDGELLSSSVERDSDGTGWPRVRYRYTVDGTNYVRKRVCLGGELAMTGTTSGAKATVAEYPPGSTVTVYYDPHKPKRSCLLSLA